MTCLIDSDVVADWLRGRPEAVRILTPLAAEYLATSQRIFRQFLRSVDVLVLTRSIMKRFVRIRSELRSRGELIGDLDILIAATALHHDLTLITGNVRHFQRIAGLRLFESDAPH